MCMSVVPWLSKKGNSEEIWEEIGVMTDDVVGRDKRQTSKSDGNIPFDITIDVIF